MLPLLLLLLLIIGINAKSVEKKSIGERSSENRDFALDPGSERAIRAIYAREWSARSLDASKQGLTAHIPIQKTERPAEIGTFEKNSESLSADTHSVDLLHKHGSRDLNNNSSSGSWTSSNEPRSKATEDSYLGVVAYNILADSAIESMLYSYINISEHLRYNPLRWYRIEQELITYQLPSLLLFQEVETAHFERNMQPGLSRLGYGTRMAHEQNWQKEAVAWRLSELELVAGRSYLMPDIIQIAFLRWLQSEASDADRAMISPMMTQLMDHFRSRPYTPQLLHFKVRSSSGRVSEVHSNAHHLSQISGLDESEEGLSSPISLKQSQVPNGQQESRLPERHLFVANLHLSWDTPRRFGLNCVQIAAILRELNAFILNEMRVTSLDSLYESRRDLELGILVGGDFNNEPERAAYEFLTDGRLHSAQANASARPDSDMFLDHAGIKRHLADVLAGFIKHPFYLQSIYKKAFGSEPPVTTRAGWAVDPLTVDYLWYHSPNPAGKDSARGAKTSRGLKLASVLSVPSKETVLHEVGLPSSLFPSDHLPIAARFTWVS